MVMKIVRVASFVSVGVLMACPAWSQSPVPAASFPARTVSFVSPVQPGSQSDVFARLLAGPLQARLGKPVIVENRAGAGGIVGASYVARAPSDGHTLLYGSLSSIVIAPQLHDPHPYTNKDLVPVALTLNGPSILVVSESVPVTTVSELISYAKANPGKLNLGSHGVGSFSHVAMELFMDATGIQMQHFPYQGGGALINGFRSGVAQVVLFDIVTVLPHVKAGKARVLAQVGEQRSPLFPDVPTVAETVAPGLTADFWLGVMAPAGTPQAVVTRLNREINDVMNTPEIRAKVEAASMLVPLRSPQAFADKLHQEWETWGRLIRAKKISAR